MEQPGTELDAPWASLGARLRGMLDGKTRDWLPLCALGVAAMIGLIATTPEARAERAPVVQSSKAAPKANAHHPAHQPTREKR